MNGSVLADFERDRRLRDLPRRCRMLLDGLDNSDNDPELVFDGLPFDAVRAAAASSPMVHMAYERLRPEQQARLFGIDAGSRGPRERQHIEIITTPRQRLGAI